MQSDAGQHSDAIELGLAFDALCELERLASLLRRPVAFTNPEDKGKTLHSTPSYSSSSLGKFSRAALRSCLSEVRWKKA